MTRLAILASHPVQYYAPLFRALGQHLDLKVFYAHAATAQDQARAGFGVEFAWDIDLLSRYEHKFLTNVARKPGLDHFWGVDTPEIGPLLREGQFDVVLIMGWYLKCFFQGLIAARRLGLPVMARGDSHLDTPRSALKTATKRLLYPYFLRQFDAALVVGKRNRAYWEKYGFPRKRIFDAPHCVDNAFFAANATLEVAARLREQLGIGPSTKLALIAGKLIPEKRPFDLIDAVALSRKGGLDVEVLVAGSGPLEDEIRARCKEFRVPLHLLGFRNQTQMPAAYAAADVLVMCSESETWGLVVNEALASGTLPLVSDAVGCAPDLAAVIGAEAVFRLGDISELAKKLQAALLAPPARELVVNTAKAFDPERVARQIASAGEKISTLKK